MTLTRVLVAVVFLLGGMLLGFEIGAWPAAAFFLAVGAGFALSKLELERYLVGRGIVSKRLGSLYRSGRSRHW